MDDEAEEMARLRKSRKYQETQRRLGRISNPLSRPQTKPSQESEVSPTLQHKKKRKDVDMVEIQAQMSGDVTVEIVEEQLDEKQMAEMNVPTSFGGHKGKYKHHLLMHGHDIGKEQEQSSPARGNLDWMDDVEMPDAEKTDVSHDPNEPVERKKKRKRSEMEAPTDDLEWTQDRKRRLQDLVPKFNATLRQYDRACSGKVSQVLFNLAMEKLGMPHHRKWDGIFPDVLVPHEVEMIDYNIVVEKLGDIPHEERRRREWNTFRLYALGETPRVRKTDGEKTADQEAMAKQRSSARQMVHEITQKYKLPITFEAKLGGHEGKVLCTALDPGGGRLVTGATDMKIQLFDFGGMREDFVPFRDYRPANGYPVVSVDFNPSGSHFLCVTANLKPKILHRDLNEKPVECVNGDMYIRDMTHTKGHTMNCTGGKWWPKDPDSFLSWSHDGTVRCWNVTNMERRCEITMKTKSPKGGRLHVTAAGISQDRNMIVAACGDGSLQWFDVRRFDSNPFRKRYNAHAANTGATSVCFGAHRMVSRGGMGDDTVKVWDTRNFTRPLHVFENLPNLDEQTSVIFSPNEKLILTGTSMVERGSLASLCLFSVDKVVHEDKKTPELKFGEVFRIPICSGSVVSLLWSAKLNQIFLGCADSKTRILYDPNLSNKGALLCSKRKKKKRHIEDTIQYLNIHNPNALREYRTEIDPHRARNRRRNDLSKKLEPHRPAHMMTTDLKFTSNTFSAQVMADDKFSSILAQENPREVLSRYDSTPNEYTEIYAVNQPRDSASATEDKSGDGDQPPQKKRRLE